jgi:hypothetical protein
MRNKRKNVMNSVKIDRDQLKTIVLENKQKHVAEYIEAVTDYKTAVLKIAKDNLKLAQTADMDKFKQIKSVPTPPQSYENDYNRAIRMLELSVETVIELEDEIFNQLVLDEWNWKFNFSLSNSTYKTLI